jgi:uncharacterized membrane protein YdjX (TVP38/TMEM64 family)
MVLPRETDGWLSQYTMDVLRVRLIRNLHEQDHNKRFKVFYPEGPGLDQRPINVHAKLMVVDDRLVTVGSANLNNRSMGLDNECNVIIDAESDQTVRSGIAGFRNRLLAEHLGCTPERVRNTLQNKNSLLATIEELTNTDKRYLNDIPMELPPNVDRVIPDTDVVDPEDPIEPELVIQRILPEHQHKPARSRLLLWVVLIAIFAGFAAMWRWTPLNEWVNLDALSNLIAVVREIPAAPIWVVLGFVLAGFVAFPFTLLIIAAVLAFGPVQGFLYALTGGTLSALAVYGVGDLLGRNTVRKLAGSKINDISQKLAKHGIITIVAVRIVPVAPFTVINLVAGASHINFRDYVIGTLLGMAPGMVAIALIADRTYATLKNPQWDNAVWLIVTLAVVFVVAYFLVKWLIRKAGDGKAE